MRTLRALVVSTIALLASCSGPTFAHAQDQTTNRNTIVAPVVKFPAICLADSLKKSNVAEATRHQCAVIKAHVDSANRQLAIARTVKVTGPKAPHKPTTHPPPTPHLPPDSSVSPVDTLTPPVAPVLAGLEIVTQPGDAASGATLTPQPVVRFVDQFHATYPSTATVTAALGAGVATITGATTIAATSGVAAFSTVGATTATTGSNTLTFSTPGYPAVTSSAFTVTAPPPPPPPPPPVPAPTIASFTASPSNLSSAGNVTLTWATTGATSLSLAPGIGNVSGTSRTLTVSATTTFTLTATNSSGSATANATVTLVPPGGLPATPGIAELPRAIVDVTYPTATRSYKIAAGANLQTVLDTAKLGDEIRLAPGAVWSGSYILPKKPSGTGTIVVRTDTSDAWLGAAGTRMTPTRAASLQLARITSSVNNSPPIGTADSAHHWRLVGLEITATAPLMNSLVRFGDAGSNGQTVLSHVPGDLIIDRSYVHMSTTGDLRRCLTFQSSNTALVDSWVAECHSNNGDSQAINGYNGPGPFYIRNNHLEAGHEVIMWGGGDPVSAAFMPNDITVVYNHIMRPPAWKGVWQAKNLLENKMGCRELFQGNVIENHWVDGQDYAINWKSENQQNTAPFTQTCDVTFRFNILRNVGAGFSINGIAGSNSSVAAARITVHDNYVTGINSGAFNGNGIPFGIGAQLAGLTVWHNTIENSGTSNSMITLGPVTGLVFDANIAWPGSFFVKGASGGSPGIPSLNQYAPGWEFLNNAIIGDTCKPAVHPATSTCPATEAGATALGPDGRPQGADMSAVNGQTAGVVVAP